MKEKKTKSLQLIVREINKKDKAKAERYELKKDKKMSVKRDVFINKLKDKIIKQIIARKSFLRFSKPEFISVDFILKNLQNDERFYNIYFVISETWFDQFLFNISWYVNL